VYDNKNREKNPYIYICKKKLDKNEKVVYKEGEKMIALFNGEHSEEIIKFKVKIKR